MSKAYECDRCGTLFKSYKNQKTSEFLNITKNPNFVDSCLDLCPKCNDELQEWAEKGKIRGEESITPQEPKIGHLIRWYETIEHDNCTEHYTHCKCSECDQEYDSYNASLFNYCPNCGAKIEKEVEE